MVFKQLSQRILCGVLSGLLLSSLCIMPPSVYADLTLPKPGTMVELSSAYVPVSMKGLTIHPENPLLFDFIFDTGHSNFQLNQPQLKEESDRLIKYFLAGLTLNDDDLWVNLSPYEKNRIVPTALGQTEMGRDMLAQDYILKQVTASLMYPEKGLGKAFWDKIYQQAQQQFGDANIPVNTFNKVWIIPDGADVYVHNNTVYIVKAHLKVMLEEDYVATIKNNRQPGDIESLGAFKRQLTQCPQAGCQANKLMNMKASQGNPASHNQTSQLIKDLILPAIEKEINEGKNFAQLRQIYQALILSTWFKNTLKENVLSQLYANKEKIAGVRSDDPEVIAKIYQQYLAAYKKGVFNYISTGGGSAYGGKKDVERTSYQPIARKYFTGGTTFKMKVNELSSIRTIDPAMGTIFSAQTAIAPTNDQAMATLIKEEKLKALNAAYKKITNTQSFKFEDSVNKRRVDNILGSLRKDLNTANEHDDIAALKQTMERIRVLMRQIDVTRIEAIQQEATQFLRNLSEDLESSENVSIEWQRFLASKDFNLTFVQQLQPFKEVFQAIDVQQASNDLFEAYRKFRDEWYVRSSTRNRNSFKEDFLQVLTMEIMALDFNIPRYTLIRESLMTIKGILDQADPARLEAVRADARLYPVQQSGGYVGVEYTQLLNNFYASPEYNEDFVNLVQPVREALNRFVHVAGFGPDMNEERVTTAEEIKRIIDSIIETGLRKDMEQAEDPKDPMSFNKYSFLAAYDQTIGMLRQAEQLRDPEQINQQRNRALAWWLVADSMSARMSFKMKTKFDQIKNILHGSDLAMVSLTEELVQDLWDSILLNADDGSDYEATLALDWLLDRLGKQRQNFIDSNRDNIKRLFVKKTNPDQTFIPALWAYLLLKYPELQSTGLDDLYKENELVEQLKVSFENPTEWLSQFAAVKIWQLCEDAQYRIAFSDIYPQLVSRMKKTDLINSILDGGTVEAALILLLDGGFSRKETDALDFIQRNINDTVLRKSQGPFLPIMIYSLLRNRSKVKIDRELKKMVDDAFQEIKTRGIKNFSLSAQLIMKVALLENGEDIEGISSQDLGRSIVSLIYGGMFNNQPADWLYLDSNYRFIESYQYFQNSDVVSQLQQLSTIKTQVVIYDEQGQVLNIDRLVAQTQHPDSILHIIQYRDSNDGKILRIGVYVSPSESDLALIANNGGIDFNRGQMKIKQTGDIVQPFQLDAAMMSQLRSGDFIGLTPTILRITAVNNLPQLLGVGQQ